MDSLRRILNSPGVRWPEIGNGAWRKSGRSSASGCRPPSSETCLQYVGNCFIAEIDQVDGSHALQDPLFDAEFMLPVAHPNDFGTTPTSFGITAIDFPDSDGLQRTIIFTVHAPEVVPRRFDIPGGSDEDP